MQDIMLNCNGLLTAMELHKARQIISANQQAQGRRKTWAILKMAGPLPRSVVLEEGFGGSIIYVLSIDSFRGILDRFEA